LASLIACAVLLVGVTGWIWRGTLFRVDSSREVQKQPEFFSRNSLTGWAYRHDVLHSYRRLWSCGIDTRDIKYKTGFVDVIRKWGLVGDTRDDDRVNNPGRVLLSSILGIFFSHIKNDRPRQLYSRKECLRERSISGYRRLSANPVAKPFEFYLGAWLLKHEWQKSKVKETLDGRTFAMIRHHKSHLKASAIFVKCQRPDNLQSPEHPRPLRQFHLLLHDSDLSTERDVLLADLAYGEPRESSINSKNNQRYKKDAKGIRLYASLLILGGLIALYYFWWNLYYRRDRGWLWIAGVILSFGILSYGFALLYLLFSGEFKATDKPFDGYYQVPERTIHRGISVTQKIIDMS
jgi:hypothetical protein